MKPITPVVPGFKIENAVFAENQRQYIPLPAWKGEDGTVVTRWHCTWRERIQILFGGSVWLTMLTFNNPLQPVKLETKCPIYGSAMLDEEI